MAKQSCGPPNCIVRCGPQVGCPKTTTTAERTSSGVKGWVCDLAYYYFVAHMGLSREIDQIISALPREPYTVISGHCCVSSVGRIAPSTQLAHHVISSSFGPPKVDYYYPSTLNYKGHHCLIPGMPCVPLPVTTTNVRSRRSACLTSKSIRVESACRSLQLGKRRRRIQIRKSGITGREEISTY